MVPCESGDACNSKSYFLQAQLHPSQVVLRTYTAEKVAIMGVLPIRVAYEGQEHDMSLVSMQGNGSVLHG